MYSLSFNSKFTLYPSELFSAEASPRVPLGELTTLPRPPRRKFCEGRYIFNFCPPREDKNMPSGGEEKFPTFGRTILLPPSPNTLRRHWLSKLIIARL